MTELNNKSSIKFITRVAFWVVTLGYFGLLRWISVARPFTPGDAIGYNLGLIGGLMMLLLLVYSARKNFKFMHRLGAMRWWFYFHISLGILGPLLVIAHSTLRLHSVNATVAFISMMMVALSGVIGRFIFRHISYDMSEKQITIQELLEDVIKQEGETKTLTSKFPDLENSLKTFRHTAFVKETDFWTKTRRFLFLPFIAKKLVYDIVPKPDKSVEAIEARRIIQTYTSSVIAASRLSIWKQLFSLWHLIHIPFLWLLLISGFVHVIAVHMY